MAFASAPMSHSTFLLLDAACTFVGLVLLIARCKFHPFVALTLGALFLGLTSGMPVDKVLASFQAGFGGVLGSVGVILGLGTMLGRLMANSGGAEQIAETLIRVFGQRRLTWAMMSSAFIVGLPLFFEIGFILLVPLVFVVVARSGAPLMKIGIPLLAALSVVHGLVPPHPGPLAAIGILGADIGATILLGIIVAIPTAVIAGPLFGNFISRRVPGNPGTKLTGSYEVDAPVRSRPGLSATLLTILTPVVLMILKTVADIVLTAQHPVRIWLDLIGHPITALLIALLLALYLFGTARGIPLAATGRIVDNSLMPIAAILLIVGAGGALKQMLIDSGIGDIVGRLALGAGVSPLVLAWLTAALIRIATGSATVAIITAAGIVAPIIELAPGVNRELLALAAGAGSLMLSHVNDAGFWLVKQYFNLTIGETLKTWSLMECILSTVALAFILLIANFV